MAASSRTGTLADGILGMVPGVVYAPDSVAEAAERVGQCARAAQSVAFAGGRTAIELGAPPRQLDALIDTRRMNRILDYIPSDMVVVAEAGVTLAQLNA